VVEEKEQEAQSGSGLSWADTDHVVPVEPSDIEHRLCAVCGNKGPAGSSVHLDTELQQWHGNCTGVCP